MAQLKYFSFFSGAGGLDIGFKEAGYLSLGASDIMDESEATFQKNWPSEPFIKKDIRKLTSKEILKITNGDLPDVIIGGPPCQGFSVMGDKNSSDPRNTLFESYVRLVNELKPSCFVFENVKGIKTMFGGRYLKEVANSFSSIGYDIHMKILNASDYGVPQKRERVIIVGTNLKNGFLFPKSSFKKIGELLPHKNVDEAIMDLVDKGEEVPNHISLNHSERVISRYNLIVEGGKLPPPEELPKEIRRKNFGNTYIRLHRNKCSPTMVPGNNAFPVHPTLNRSLTPREAARIQTFPDDVIFSGNRRKQCILVGNAVPPLLAANIALSVKEHLESKKVIISENLLLERNGKLNELKNSDSPTVIDLFSGAGGIMIGMKKAGFNPILCADFNELVAKTHKHNFPKIPFIKGDLSNKDIKKEILSQIKNKEVDLIVGGPPCQGFSIFGKRRFVNTKEHNPKLDSRNKLVFTFLDYIKTIKPKWFLMENVPGIVNMDNGTVVKKLIKEFKKIGYKDIEYKIINTADYGVPQKRKRFILLGNRMNQFIPWPKPKFYEDPKDWQKPYRKIAEVITDLAEESSHVKFNNQDVPNHSKIVSERMKYIKEGQKMDVDLLPTHLKLGKHTGKAIKNFSHVYKRLDRNKPSGTLVPGHSAFPIHPWLNRQLTVREAARIQTFPDEIDFQGSHMEQCTQVGNAFPSLAAETLGNLILKSLKNNWNKENLSNLAKYSLTQK